VFFELNGQPREIVVSDHSLAGKAATRIKAAAGNPKEIGAPMPGSISRILVGKGETVSQGQKLFTLEAMKMETTVASPNSGKIQEILTPAGTQVDGGDLVLKMA
jgi:pyruvate carboxylase